MKYTEFTVTYELDAGMVNYLNKLTERWKSTGREITPEELFSLAMNLYGNCEIKRYLDNVEQFLERQGV